MRKPARGVRAFLTWLVAWMFHPAEADGLADAGEHLVLILVESLCITLFFVKTGGIKLYQYLVIVDDNTAVLGPKRHFF